MASYQSNYTGAQIDTAISKVNSITSTAQQIDNTVGDVNNLSTTIANAIAQAKLAMYPVGSIYMSVNSTNPATFIGGTWARITDVFLLASGNTYSPGATGGEAQVTLSVNTIPSHSHAIYAGWGDIGNPTVDSDAYRFQYWGGNGREWRYGNLGTNSIGGGQPHNNMPPYLAVYVWQRTA